MIKLIVFLILAIIVINAFSIDFSFFLGGFGDLLNSIVSFTPTILQFVINCIGVILSAPFISKILGVLFALSVVFLIYYKFIGGESND